MTISPTYHAMLRWNERLNDNYTVLDEEVITELIKEEFKKAKFVKNKNNNTKLYASSDNIFIVDVNQSEDEYTIITIYPKCIENGIKLEKIKSENTIIKTHLKLSKEDLKKITIVINCEDYITVKIMGSKRFIVIGKDLLLIRIEYNIDKTYITIVKQWKIDDLHDLDTLKDFKESYCNTFTITEWEEFLKILNISKCIVRQRKEKEKMYEPEIQIYRQVLNKTLRSFPYNFWKQDVGGESNIASKLCVQYLIEEVLKWDTLAVYNYFNTNTFKNYKLGGMLAILFSSNSFAALDNAYPNRFKPWLFKEYKGDIRYWNVENDGIKHSKEAIQWLLNQSKNDGITIVKENLLSYNWEMILKKYNLMSILTTTYDNDFKKFFKSLFNVEFDDIEIERYVLYHKLRMGSKFTQVHV